MKTALLIGATGLTGTHLLNLLLTDLRFEEVIIFVRRSTGISHPKLQEHVIDFDHPETWSHLVKGDVLFSALGTTIKIAKNKDAQYKVDFTYQYEFAKAALQNEVPVYVLISVSGANAKSLFFYLRMKGELEDAIRQLSFPRIRIIEPGPIAGERPVVRPLEQLSFRVIRFLNKLGMGDQYQPIEADMLARAMRNAALRPEPGLEVFRLDEVFELAEQA